MQVKIGTIEDQYQILSLIEAQKQQFPMYQQSSFSKQLVAYLQQSLTRCVYDEDELVGFLGFHMKRKQVDLFCVKEGYQCNQVVPFLIQSMLADVQEGDQITMQIDVDDQPMHACLLAMGFVLIQGAGRTKKTTYRITKTNC